MVILEAAAPEDIKLILQQGLRAYNQNFLGHYDRKNFAFYIKNTAGEVVAGVYGFVITQHKTMRLEFIWVQENNRGQGFGTQLLQAVDRDAMTQGCHTIQVSTMDFQGVMFYEKMGYQQVGVIPQWFCDKDEVFLVKNL